MTAVRSGLVAAGFSCAFVPAVALATLLGCLTLRPLPPPPPRLTNVLKP